MAKNESTVIVTSKEDLDLVLFNSLRSTLTILIPDFLKTLESRRFNDSISIVNGESKLISKKEAASLLSCSSSTIDNLRRSGKLDLVKVGKSARFRLSDIQSIIRRESK